MPECKRGGLSRHHLYPKSVDGSGQFVHKQIILCKTHHEMLHRLASNTELALHANTRDKVVELLINGFLPHVELTPAAVSAKHDFSKPLPMSEEFKESYAIFLERKKERENRERKETRVNRFIKRHPKTTSKPAPLISQHIKQILVPIEKQTISEKKEAEFLHLSKLETCPICDNGYYCCKTMTLRRIKNLQSELVQ